MARDGAAREVGRGRLAHFEDEADDSEQKVAVPSLPPRSRRSAARGPVSGEGGDPTPAAQDPAPQAGEDAQDSSQPLVDAPAPPAEPAVAPARAPAGSGDRMRPSNVHVPVALLESIARTCKERGLSHGELIISAIEHTHADLAGLIHPATTAGGSLFASRRSRAVRSKDGPLTPLNYRLRASDFEVIDQLVEDFSASSRGDLITTALAAYLSPSS